MKPCCPACRSGDVEDLGRKYPVYPMGCVSTLGFPLSFLHQGQIPHDLRCRECGREFKRRSRLAKLNLAAVVGLLLLFVFGILKFFVFGW